MPRKFSVDTQSGFAMDFVMVGDSRSHHLDRMDAIDFVRLMLLRTPVDSLYGEQCILS